MAGQPGRESEPEREEQGAREPAPTRTPDPEALLCGLVLSPGTWSRNRMFALYEDPRARRARRRAQHVRSVVALLRRRGGSLAEVLRAGAGQRSGDGDPRAGEGPGEGPGGGDDGPRSGEGPAGAGDAERDVEIVIDVPEMNLVRRTRLSPLELSLVRYVLRVGEPTALAHDRGRVEGALGRLMLPPS